MRRNRFAAFTLAELLVVVSVMALLMAMLFPALNGARRQAQIVVCMSNQRSIVFDFIMVTNDPSGLKRWKTNVADESTFGLSSFIDRLYGAGAYYLLKGVRRNGREAGPRYPRIPPLKRHVGGNQIFFCPAAPRKLDVLANRRVLDGAVVPEENISYAFNARLDHVYRLNEEGTQWQKAYVILSSNIFDSWRDAPTTPLIADVDATLAAAQPGSRDRAHLMAPAIEPFGEYVADPDRPQGRQWFPPMDRHKNQYNVALFDGSVVRANREDNPQDDRSIGWADTKYGGSWIDGVFEGPTVVREVKFSESWLSPSRVY